MAERTAETEMRNRYEEERREEEERMGRGREVFLFRSLVIDRDIPASHEQTWKKTENVKGLQTKSSRDYKLF